MMKTELIIVKEIIDAIIIQEMLQILHALKTSFSVILYKQAN